jgi:nicotinamidase-related amidase
MPAQERLDVVHAQLVVVDIQEALIPHVRGHADLIDRTLRMLRAARVVDIPITITEQYRKGLGPTTPAILQAADGIEPMHKMTFSVCGDPSAREHLIGNMRPAVLLAGIETHVCVQQTALDLLSLQMRPFILADAVGSRRRPDHEIALQRMQAAGAIVTTVESAILHLAGKAGTDLFRRVLPLVR